MKLNLIGDKRITNLEELFNTSNIDLKERDIIKTKLNKRETAMNKKDWSTELTELFQIRAEIKPKHNLLAPDIKQILIDSFDKHIQVRNWPPYKHWPLLASITLADLHIGRIEQKKPKAYQTQIYDRCMRLFEALLWCKPDKLLFASIGDMANSEMNWTTSSWKHAMENNMTGNEIFQNVLEFHNDLIKSFASEIATDVLIIPGNHDRELMKVIWTALQIWFNNTNNVKIDNQNKPRKYVQWWDNTLAFSHWDWEKPSQRLSVLSQEDKIRKHNYWTIWHFHDREVKQYWPLEVETVASPAIQNDWEKNKYAHKTAKIWGKIYDKKQGKVKEIYK